MSRDTLSLVLGALAAVLLQIVVAPNIAIMGAMPNVIAAYVVIAAIVRPADSVLVLGFVLGIVYDLLGYGPIGAMAFLLTLLAFLATRTFGVLDSESPFMPVAVIVCAMLLLEALYAGFLVALGQVSGFGTALLYRALPCALFDCVVALLLYPLARRLIAPGVFGSIAGGTAEPIVRTSDMPSARPVVSGNAPSRATHRRMRAKKRF